MRLIKFFLIVFSVMAFASDKPGLADMLSDPSDIDKESNAVKSGAVQNKVIDPFSAKTPLPDAAPVFSPEDKVADTTTPVANPIETSKPVVKTQEASVSEPVSHPIVGPESPSTKDDQEKDLDVPQIPKKAPEEAGSEKTASNTDIKKDSRDSDFEGHESDPEEDSKAQELLDEEDKEDEQRVDQQRRTQSPFEEEDEERRRQFQESDPFEPSYRAAPVEEEDEDSESVSSQPSEEIIESELDLIEASDQGNWVLKRVWWEQAQDVFGKIIKLNDQIVQLQMQIVTKRNDFDKSIDSLFKEVGLGLLDVTDLIGYLLSLGQKEDSEYGEQENKVIIKIDSKKEDLDKIKSSLQEIANKNNLISESLIQLMHLVNECRQYEYKSWSNFKEIGSVLNDEKAKSLYYEIEANYKNVDSIFKYISGELSKFIDDNILEVEKVSQEVVSTIKQLDDEDFNLKELKEHHKGAVEEDKKNKELKEQEAQRPKKKISKGFFGKIADWFGSLFKTVKGWFGFK
jgi:hypothetical protein